MGAELYDLTTKAGREEVASPEGGQEAEANAPVEVIGRWELGSLEGSVRLG